MARPCSRSRPQARHRGTVRGRGGSARRCYGLLGQITEAVERAEQAAAGSGALNLMANHPRDVSYLSEAYLFANRLDEAETTGRRALELCRRPQHSWHEVDTLRILGEIYSRREPPAVREAEDSYCSALLQAEELGMRPPLARCHLGFGQLYQRTGKPRQARGHLAAAASLLREMNLHSWLEQANATLAGDGHPSDLTRDATTTDQPLRRI